MFIPQEYAIALLMMIVSMLCWGSWANTFKLCKNWRFELYYWDYVAGLFLCSLILGLTMGRTNPADPASFFANLGAADARHILYGFAGGVVFNLGNILLVAAIAIAGLAVAFPVSIGLALVIGAGLNYIITPRGNPVLLFGGIALVCVAIVLDALAYGKISADLKVTKKGIALCVVSGILIGLFYPLVAKALSGENHLVPYTVFFVFALGIAASNIPLNYGLMRRPVSGPPVEAQAYFRGSRLAHFWGLLGGLIWGLGTLFNFVASFAQMVGPATSYALGQGATMVSALWGVLVWKEFAGAGREVIRLLVLMFVFFVTGLACIALAPVVRW